MSTRAKRRSWSTRQSQGTATQTMMLTHNPTQTVVRVNEQQSLHIVQTSVAAALSAILCSNDLFPDTFFETRSYKLDDPAFPYTVKPACQSAREIKQQENDKTRITWDFLIKGKNPKADKIWVWLDGIFDALKHRYLASFQFSLHDGDRSLDTVAQSYVMKFNYSQNGGEIDIDISSGGQTVEVAAKDMQNLKIVFSRLIKMSREAGGLPDEPEINFVLTYNKTCPEEYEPRGFVTAPSESVIINEGEAKIGEINTKYHSVGMSRTVISNGPSGAATRTNCQQTFNSNGIISTQADDSPCEVSSILNTQERVERQLIREMVPVGREVGDTQRAEDTQSQRTPVDRSSPTPLPHRPAGNPMLLPEERRFYLSGEIIRDLHPLHKWRNQQVQISFSEGKATDCHCNKKFAGMTVQCEICQKIQHIQCYGYLETDVMDTHLCYKCLLVSEPDLRNEMQRLCLLRQVAWVACTDGYPLKELALGVRIGCTAKEVIALSQRLVSEKYLRKISRPQSKKHKDYNRRSEIPPYEFLTEESERLLKEYLNPTFKIEEYLREHPQSTSDSPQQSQQPSSPTPPHHSNSSLSSISPESERSIPNAIPPTTPHSKLESTGPIFGIFCGDDVDTTKTLSAAEMAAASSMYASTQGTSSYMGSPGPRPAIGVKRKGSALERSGRKRKQPSWVNSPFVLKRGVRE
ncbi:hypothetical protein O988_08640 [Pseudogymnoascus sp. VKM F-3808]|nr:hypothetical protein O988_08640 [Pseudogymnoascus sp. VKM F-3808]